MPVDLPPLPLRMQRLPCDHRGFPIPFIVLRDNDDRPHFTINDSHKRALALAEDRCGICGQKLLRGRWFVGGPASAFHPHGAYIDGPLHFECATYALQVCPYLAAPRYAGHIDAKTVDPAKLPPNMLFMDTTMDPTRPDIFVAVMATGQSYTTNGYIRPRRPYLRGQVWQHGTLLRELDKRECADMETALDTITRIDSKGANCA